jgi:hypothetical protein
VAARKSSVPKATGREDLEAFKKITAEVGMYMAKQHNLCDVVRNTLINQLGLAEFIPPEIVIQTRHTSRAKWDRYTTHATEKEAVDSAIQRMRHSLPRKANYQYMDFTIYPTTDPADVAKKAQQMIDNMKPSPTEVPRFPQYRVVRTFFGSKPDEVLKELGPEDLFDEDFAKKVRAEWKKKEDAAKKKTKAKAATKAAATRITVAA